MATKVMVKNVRVSYVHVFEPSAITDGAKEKYSVSILIRPDDKANLDAINAAVNEAYAEGLKNPKIWNGKQPVLFKHPLRNGNEKDPDKNPEYVGMFFIGANSDDKPLVVNRSREVISSPSEIQANPLHRNRLRQIQRKHAVSACGLHSAEPFPGCPVLRDFSLASR